MISIGDAVFEVIPGGTFGIASKRWSAYFADHGARHDAYCSAIVAPALPIPDMSDLFSQSRSGQLSGEGRIESKGGVDDKLKNV
jgi:hypothetical protein